MTSKYTYGVHNWNDNHVNKYENHPDWYVCRSSATPYYPYVEYEYLGKDLVWRGSTNYKDQDLTAYCETKEEAEQRLKDWQEQNAT